MVIPSYPPDSHHYSDVVYWGSKKYEKRKITILRAFSSDGPFFCAVYLEKPSLQ